MAVAQQNHIHLINSNSSLSKMFRVIQEGYDDGTWNRSETVRRQVGGGIDHSYGDTYRTWSPVIRVRQSEAVSGYGTSADLETFFCYNNPNATPSTVISFVPHVHDESGPTPTYSVHFVGNMQKVTMGCMIYGGEAWFLYRLTLMEVS